MTVKVILNPYSNRWNSQRRWAEADRALRTTGVDFDLSVSEHPHHIPDLAAAAVRKGFTTIVVAGGDGSIGEAINGIASVWDEKSPFPATLGLLPLGTANDLYDNLGMPRETLKDPARIIAGGNTRSIDLAKCNDHYFVNNSACGLEPYVSTKQEKITWISGVPRYLVAAVQGIMDNPTWNAKLEWDGGSYEGPLNLVSVGNGARTGGVFFMTPHANLYDGKLTFIYGYRETRREMFGALPRAMKQGDGNIAEVEWVHEIDCTHLKIKLDHSSPAHTDGELFPDWVTDLEYKVFPSTVKILAP